MTNVLIIDSWPVLEWLRRREPACSAFDVLLTRAGRNEVRLQMSRINAGEVWYQVSRRLGLDVYPSYRAYLDRLPVEFVSVDDLLVDEAADLEARFSIAYADCFAAALAVRTQSPVVTGDPDFLKLQNAGVLQVRWLGK